MSIRYDAEKLVKAAPLLYAACVEAHNALCDIANQEYSALQEGDEEVSSVDGVLRELERALASTGDSFYQASYRGRIVDGELVIESVPTFPDGNTD
jgi:hypothetical protein